MSNVPHGPGGTVFRACAYDSREAFGRLIAVRKAEQAVRADVGPYLSGEPAFFEFDRNVPEQLRRMYEIAHWDAASARLREVHKSVEQLGEHAALVVAVVAVIDGYAEARAEADAVRPPRQNLTAHKCAQHPRGDCS